MKKNVVIYGRVSTKTQNINSQLFSLYRECEENDYNVLKYFKDDGISGLIDDRCGINELINYVENNKVDKIIVSELTRISRNEVFLKNFIIKMSNINVSIFLIDKQFETLRTNNTLNTNVLTILMDEIKYANNESIKVKNRLKNGYENYIKKGGSVGRKKGYKKSDSEYLLQYENIVTFLKEGYSYRMINNITGIAINTVKKVKNILIKNGDIFEDVKKIRTDEIMKELFSENPEVMKNILQKYTFKR